MYYYKSSWILRSLYGPRLTWSIEGEIDKVYLTFDDGPTPGVTKKVLEFLNDFKIKATFFCVGNNIKRNPDIFQEVISQGHKTGNHTYNHLNGWKSPFEEYINNVAKSEENVRSSLFRPPYGKITRRQSTFLLKKYNIIMWTALSGDFDHRTSKDQCLYNALNINGKGSIVVFHDSIKAKERMFYALPRFIEECLKRNYSFHLI